MTLHVVPSLRTAIEASEEIRGLVAAGDLARAGRRLLDFGKDFKVPRELENEAVRLVGRINLIRRQIRQTGQSQDASVDQNELLGSILELLDEMVDRREDPKPPSLRLVDPAVVEPIAVKEGDAVTTGRDAMSVASVAVVDAKPEPTRFEAAREAFIVHRTHQSPPETVACRCTALSKVYRGRGGFELSDVAFDLRPGEITGVIGVNGAGKTTILRIVAGEFRASGGTVTYPLLSRMRDNDWAHIRRQIAYVEQAPAQWYGKLADNLHLAASVHGVHGRDNEDEVEFLLQRLGLDEFRDHLWHQISGGFKMRFELARALVSQPKLLVLDEPLAPLDILTQQLFLQDLRDLANSVRNPLSIIVSSQHLYEIESIADQILFLDGGKQVYGGRLSEVGSDRTDNVLELSCVASRAVLERHLETLPILDIETFGTTYHVRVPRSTSASDVIKTLAAANLELTYFRDISRSTRRLFDGRMNSV